LQFASSEDYAQLPLLFEKNGEIKEKLAKVLIDSGQNQEAANLFLELAQQALFNEDTFNTMRLCRLALDAIPGYEKAWKILLSINSLLQKG
jgi:hypothetical protein